MFTCFSHVSLNDCNHSRTACCFAGCQSGFHSQTAVCNEKYKDEIVSVFRSVVSGLKAIVLPTVVPLLSGTSVPGVTAPQNSTRAHFPPVRVDDPDHKDNFCTDVQSLNIYLSIKKGIAYICVKKSKSVVLNILAETACLIISSLNSWVTSMLGKQLNKMCTVDMVTTKDTWVQRLLTRDLYKIQKLLF